MPIFRPEYVLTTEFTTEILTLKAVERCSLTLGFYMSELRRQAFYTSNHLRQSHY
jgi:hypothetical protein